MRFLGRALIGLFLTACTVGLFALAGSITYGALQARWADEGRVPPTRERVFAAEVAPLTFGDETPVLTAFGEIRSRRTLELRAPAEGTVVELAEGFEDGGAVTSGQLLARIDPAEAQSARDTAAADLQDAENELAEATRALELAEEEVTAARNQAEIRSRALERARDLLERGVGSTAAVETAELAEATAAQAILSQRRALAVAEARVDNAGTALSRRQIALAEAERRLAETELRAAFSGVLTDVDAAAGRLVSRNERLASLIDADALEVAFRISTAQYIRLLDADGNLPERPVRVILDVFGLDMTADATLTRESGAVEEGQSGRLLFARIDNARGLRVGDFVRVEVDEPTLSDVARLPAAALGSDGEILLLGEDNVLEAVEVALLSRQGDEVLVRPTASAPRAGDGEGAGAGDAAGRRGAGRSDGDAPGNARPAGQTATRFEGRDVVLVRTPVLGEGIRVNPIRPGAEDAPEVSDTIALDPERRARLITYVETDGLIPDDARTRMLQQLNEEEVPLRIVNRLEARMGS
ncbi:efflux RND transporter periplasmic adaptor subunit [Gymnodinialimonas ceratoperidinii]|uniref:efflux RND transporter periplasmic adaptor subunit n=1 Tax=Gymnodinialimonas ceratoperidinii TaxID=2856823 RepID=UPI001FFD591A|nr:HlyD family efflux transporter periplasmic adaptor subunit [Gymnodinialimonas ceratoperidinii]